MNATTSATGAPLTGELTPVSTAIIAPPRIGDLWPDIDGKYAGIAKGENGEADHHLVRLNVVPLPANWHDAMKLAAEMGADLPTRSESALLYAHLRDDTETSDRHWTKEQSSESHAWSQNVSNGYQSTNYKKVEALFRPVRRLPLQSFNPSKDGEQ